MLAVAFEFGHGLIDLLRAQFSEVDLALDSIVEGGDGCGSGIFAFSDSNSGSAFANSIVVAGNVFSG